MYPALSSRPRATGVIALSALVGRIRHLYGHNWHNCFTVLAVVAAALHYSSWPGRYPDRYPDRHPSAPKSQQPPSHPDMTGRIERLLYGFPRRHHSLGSRPSNNFVKTIPSGCHTAFGYSSTTPDCTSKEMGEGDSLVHRELGPFRFTSSRTHVAALSKP